MPKPPQLAAELVPSAGNSDVLASEHKEPANLHSDHGCGSELRSRDDVRAGVGLFSRIVRHARALQWRTLGFQLSGALGGGFSPIIATALAGYMGGTAGVSMMLILLASITFISTLFARETKGETLVETARTGLSEE
jgi:hypothetical protein